MWKHFYSTSWKSLKDSGTSHWCFCDLTHQVVPWTQGSLKASSPNHRCPIITKICRGNPHLSETAQRGHDGYTNSHKEAGEAVILMWVPLEASGSNSFISLSSRPEKRVVPPDSTISAKTFSGCQCHSSWCCWRLFLRVPGCGFPAGWGKKNFGHFVQLVPNVDDVPIWQFVFSQDVSDLLHSFLCDSKAMLHSFPLMLFTKALQSMQGKVYPLAKRSQVRCSMMSLPATKSLVTARGSE